MEPFLNHQVVGGVNQSTASLTAYPIPIEKVKNGYEYIIRGSEDNKTEEKPKIDTSIVDAHCDKDFYEIYMDSNGNKRIRDVDVIWYAGDDIEENPYRYGTTHYNGLLIDFVELEDYNETLSLLEQWSEDWSEEEAVQNVIEMLKNRKYLPLSKVNAYTECGLYWG